MPSAAIARLSGSKFPLKRSPRRRRTLHPNLSGLPAAGCLLWPDVALRVSIHCCRPVAAVIGRAGCANQKAGLTLAWLRLLAGLSTAPEQQPAALCPEKCDTAVD